MNILEIAIGLLAPHNCIVCRRAGRVLCAGCASVHLCPQPSRCYKCHRAAVQSQTCQNCREQTGISRVWVSASYEKTAKELVRKLKFARAQSAAKDIAAIIDENLPILPGQTIITHLPTASSRIRVRGYDQAQAIAKALAKRRGLPYMALLGRKGSARQVGASRTSRFEQLQGVFFAKNAKNVSGAHILLVDDVLTTGASVESAAARLKASGAKTVDVAVFAQP